MKFDRRLTSIYAGRLKRSGRSRPMSGSSVPQLSSGGAMPCAAAPVVPPERLHRLARTLLLWHERARQRRHLRYLSDHMLRDIGLTPDDVRAEAGKPFWRG